MDDIIVLDTKYNWEEYGVPERYKDVTLSTLVNFAQYEWIDEKGVVSNHTADELKALIKLVPHASYIFYGDKGTGKTHIAVSILKGLKRMKGDSLSCYFTTAFKMMPMIKNFKVKEERIHFFSTVDVLIIDEMEKVSHEEDRDKDVFYGLLNERYNNCKTTIMTSNAPFDEIKRILGDTGIDRIREVGKSIKCIGESYRTIKKSEV